MNGMNRMKQTDLHRMIRVPAPAAIASHHPLPRRPYLYVTSMNLARTTLQHRSLHRPQQR
jgi:hypothetical protein